MSGVIEESSNSVFVRLRQSSKPICRATAAAGIVAAFLLGGSAAQSAPVFANAGFEAGFSVGSFDLMNPVNTPGWTITLGSGSSFPRLNRNQSCGGLYGNNNAGCQYAVLGGPRDEPGGGSKLSQTFSTFVKGNTYVLSWLQASEFTEGDWVTASIIGGGPTLSQDFFSNPYPGGGSFWFGPWQTMNFQFVAQATVLTLQFASSTNHGFFSEPGIDMVGLADVNQVIPEPATLALLGTGLLIIVARKRKQA